MLSQLLDAMKRVVEGARPWVVVAPWERALRVRAGKRVRVLREGFHLKIPFIDRVIVVETRARINETGRQTITRSKGEEVTFSGTVEFFVDDIEAMFQSINRPSDYVQNAARNCMAVAVRKAESLDIEELSKVATGLLRPQLDGKGLSVKEIRFSECVAVRTYRLIGDHVSNYTGDRLDQKLDGNP